MASEFRFLHISDLHLAVAPGLVNWWDAIRSPSDLFAEWRNAAVSRAPTTFDRAVAQKLRLLIQRRLYNDRDVDGIIVTGDVASTGSRLDLLAARQYFEGGAAHWGETTRFATSKSLLSENRFAFLPGNHDRYSTLLLPSSDKFEADSCFGGNWSANQMPGASVDNMVRSYGFARGDDQIVFCCVDLSLERWSQETVVLGYLGQGIVTDARLDGLRQATVRHQERGRTVVWAFHYPPEYAGCPDLLKLIGGERLSALGAELGVRLCLCGHLHQLRTYQVPAGLTVACSGTACAFFEEENAFSELSLVVDGDRLESCRATKFVWDWAGDWKAANTTAVV